MVEWLGGLKEWKGFANLHFVRVASSEDIKTHSGRCYYTKAFLSTNLPLSLPLPPHSQLQP